MKFLATLALFAAVSINAEPDVLFDATNAQGTPDDVPPAWEILCEKASGGDNQAFGLCIAYCEARDCDIGTDSKPCEQLRENYMEITGAAMPCDFECPCIGGLKRWADALETIDEGSCFEDGLDYYRPYFLIYVSDDIILATEKMEDNGIWIAACGFAYTMQYLVITPTEFDQCNSFLISLNLDECLTD